MTTSQDYEKLLAALKLALGTHGNPTAIISSEIALAIIAALEAAQSAIAEPAEDWRNDPAQDDRWNEGVDFAQMQLCTVLKVDPKSISWDAATETLDGDVQSVIGKILDAGLGNDDWRSPGKVDDEVKP